MARFTKCWVEYFIDQRPGSDTSVRKLLLFIYKGGVFDEGKNQRKIIMTLIQIVCPNRIGHRAGK